jgi:hypothetical protein
MLATPRPRDRQRHDAGFTAAEIDGLRASGTVSKAEELAGAGSSGAAAGARFSTISLSAIFIRLDGKPTIVVHCRNDDRVPVNSRPASISGWTI